MPLSGRRSGGRCWPADPLIATGVILALSRAIGEAAPLLLVGAATFVTFDPQPFSGGYSAMPVQIFNYALRPRTSSRGGAAGVILMLIVLLAMNSFAIWLRNRYEQQWQPIPQTAMKATVDSLGTSG